MGINIGKKKKIRVQTGMQSKGFNFVTYIMMDLKKKISDDRFFFKKLSSDFFIRIDHLKFIFLGGGFLNSI